MIPGMGGLSKMLVGQQPGGRPPPPGRHYRFHDARRTPQFLEDDRPEPPPPHCRGGGVEPYQVNDLVKQFDGMADIMKKLAGMGFMERMKTIQQLGSSDMLNPNAKFAKHVKRTGRRLTPEEIIRRLRKLRDDEDNA